MRQIFGDSVALLWQETSGLVIGFVVLQINFLVGCIDIPTDDHLFASGMHLVAQLQQSSVKIQLERHP